MSFSAFKGCGKMLSFCAFYACWLIVPIGVIRMIFEKISTGKALRASAPQAVSRLVPSCNNKCWYRAEPATDRLLARAGRALSFSLIVLTAIITSLISEGVQASGLVNSSLLPCISLPPLRPEIQSDCRFVGFQSTQSAKV